MNTSEESAPTPEQFQTKLNSAQPDIEEPSSQYRFNPDNPPWGLAQALLTWFLSVVLVLFLPLVFGLPYIMYRYQGVATRETLLADKTFIFFSVLTNIPVHILTFLLAWAVITQLGKFQFREMIGWSWSANFGFWKSAGLAVILFGLALALVLLFGGPETEVERIIQSSRATAYTLAFLAVATAPLVEETVYRGMLYPAFQRSIGMTGAVIVVAGLFAVGHVYQYWPNFGVISAIVLLSVALTLVRARTGRLLPCFIIHLVFNGIQAVEIVLSPYIRTLDPGGEHKAAAIVLFLRNLHWFV